MSYEFITESRVGIVAYDISIKNLEERKEKAIVYPSIKNAQQKLGLNFGVIKHAAGNRGRVYSPNYEKELAIRYAKTI